MGCAASKPAPASKTSPLQHAALSEPRFQYTPLTAPDNIRLLRILASSSDEVAVSLEEVRLQDDVAYECLSYTQDRPKYSDEGIHWTTNHRRIVCNNAVTYIRQNLHDALLQLRNSGILGPI
jgi:hypothetical protein